jgi:DNA-binding transcriptional LysR family regulator
MARTFILPDLPTFLKRHPALTIHIGEGDRFVDIVREGFDCVIRAGENTDSDMMARRLGLAREATFASPAYLASHGVPFCIEDLRGHEMIGFASSRTGVARAPAFPHAYLCALSAQPPVIPARARLH